MAEPNPTVQNGSPTPTLSTETSGQEQAVPSRAEDETISSGDSTTTLRIYARKAKTDNIFGEVRDLGPPPHWAQVGIARRKLRRTLIEFAENVADCVEVLTETGDVVSQQHTLLETESRVQSLMEHIGAVFKELVEPLRKYTEAVSGNEISSHQHEGNRRDDCLSEGHGSDAGSSDTSVFSTDSTPSDYTMSPESAGPPSDSLQYLTEGQPLITDVSIWNYVLRNLRSQGRLFIGPIKVSGVNDNIDFDVQNLDMFDREFLPRFYQAYALLRNVALTTPQQRIFMSSFEPDITLKWPDCIKDQEKLADLRWAAELPRGQGRVLLAYILQATSSMWEADSVAFESYIQMIGPDHRLRRSLTRIILVCQPLENLPRKARDI
ncbi:unnamed protein product [Jaminaea pallidilutea]